MSMTHGLMLIVRKLALRDIKLNESNLIIKLRVKPEREYIEVT